MPSLLIFPPLYPLHAFPRSTLWASCWCSRTEFWNGTWPLKPQSPSPCDVLPKPTQTLSVTGDQVFKHARICRGISLKWAAVSRGMCAQNTGQGTFYRIHPINHRLGYQGSERVNNSSVAIVRGAAGSPGALITGLMYGLGGSFNHP